MRHELRSAPGGPLVGHASVPGDKSISHRALILGALALGETAIYGLLEAEDIIATAHAVTALGALAQKAGERWLVAGVGIGGMSAPSVPLDFGNSGTGARLMMGVLAGLPIRATLTGDASLSRRPMRRVLTPLLAMGAEVEDGRDTLPLTLRGSAQLAPMVYELPVPSAQVKSAVLLAGLSAPGETSVIEAEPTRDHTEKMLAAFGATVTIAPHERGRIITVRGQPTLHGRAVRVPGDPSSAAFLAGAAAITTGSDITIEGVLVNPTRTGFYETLREMGADLSFGNARTEAGEDVADIRVRHAALSGVTVPAERAPRMIDEYPMLAVIAAFARGETRMDGLAELKVKESDRLAATVAGLVANGVVARAEGDSMIVRGGRVPGGGHVATQLDHRIAMSFLVLGLAAERPVTIDDGRMIATSFPTFVPLMRQLGAAITEAEPAL